MSTYRAFVRVELTVNTVSNRVETDFITDIIWITCIIGAEIDSGTSTTLMPSFTSCIEFVDWGTVTGNDSLGFLISDLTPAPVGDHFINF